MASTDFPSQEALQTELVHRYKDMLSDGKKREDWVKKLKTKFDEIQTKRRKDVYGRLANVTLKPRSFKEKNKTEQEKREPRQRKAKKPINYSENKKTK